MADLERFYQFEGEVDGPRGWVDPKTGRVIIIPEKPEGVDIPDWVHDIDPRAIPKPAFPDTHPTQVPLRDREELPHHPPPESLDIE